VEHETCKVLSLLPYPGFSSAFCMVLLGPLCSCALRTCQVTDYKDTSGETSI